jgi:cytochrome c oxidase subunit 2
MMPAPPAARYARAVGAAAMGLGLAACAPAPATAEGGDIKFLYDIFLVVAAGVFLLVAGLIGWSIVRYRAPDDADLPPQTEANVRLELLWWALPTILVIGLFILTAGVLNRVDARAADGGSLVVRVTGFQWQWRFDYEESGVSVVGLPDERPEAVVPVGEPITFVLESPDVQHSFYVPRFIMKRDVVPGRENRVDVTIDEEGTYTGLCAEFCGLLHAEMYFTIRAVSPDAFEAWLAEEGTPS